ncbi:MAG: HNH endonuclease [Planctomycetes bacterium]|nr:HNH endonuclease [Planctomycetota bacterium]
MNACEWGRGVTRRVQRRDVPRDVLALVVERDGLGCAACMRLGLTSPKSEPLELDHKQPLSLGGDNHWTNLQILCRSHNRARGKRPIDAGTPPAWLRRLAQAGALADHVRRCRAAGLVWSPRGAWLTQQINALLPKGLTS